MPIIVDKVKRRQEIALSCLELFTNEANLNCITITKIAQTAKIAKGSFYDYFKNKEDVVFEIASILIETRNEKKRKIIDKIDGTKEKMILFFDFFYSNYKEDAQLRAIYKSFLAISLTNPNEEIKQFHTDSFNIYYNWALEITKEGIEKNEIKKESINFVKTLFETAEGMFLASIATYAIKDLEHEINDYINNLFELLEVKK